MTKDHQPTTVNTSNSCCTTVLVGEIPPHVTAAINAPFGIVVVCVVVYGGSESNVHLISIICTSNIHCLLFGDNETRRLRLLWSSVWLMDEGKEENP